MNDERYDNIEYNDNWQSIPVVRATAVDYYEENDNYSDENFEDDTDNIEENQTASAIRLPENPQPVIKLQFFISLIVILLAFLLKNFGGDVYTRTKEIYFTNLNHSLVVTLPEDFMTFSKVNRNER